MVVIMPSFLEIGTKGVEIHFQNWLENGEDKSIVSIYTGI